MGTIKLDDFEAEYYENDSRLKYWFTEILKRNRKSNFIKVAFGITLTKDTQIIRFINKLLGKIGLKLVRSRKGTDDTVYYKLHQESVLDADRIAVLQALTFKYEQQQLEQLTREQSALEEKQRQVDSQFTHNEVIQETTPTANIVVELQPQLSNLEKIKLDELQVLSSEVSEETDNYLLLWSGLKVRLQQGLENAGRFYKETVSEIGQAVGVAEGEPFWNAYSSRWHVAVNFANGCRSLCCNWLEAIA